ncbi:phospholipid-translocating P-type ATPase [Fistulina hepatica ATCC 64428]|nr:phospholipid-translocating P-type ATPase [Fistulina hepatica ATCC 64428]
MRTQKHTGTKIYLPATLPHPSEQSNRPLARLLARLTKWREQVASFSVERLFSRKREPGPPRTVWVNQPLPNDYYERVRSRFTRVRHTRIKREHVYMNNEVITSKYNIITFLPRNLLEQFRRVANVFFLAIAVLQFFSIFSTISPGLVILPLIIVLGITAAKDAYEDVKRHQSDAKVNNAPILVLTGWRPDSVDPTVDYNPEDDPNFLKRLFRRLFRRKRISISEPEDARPTHPANIQQVKHTSNGARWELRQWHSLRPGDIVRIHDGEAVPADMLICVSGGEDGVAFAETKNLDGETNLKSRSALDRLSFLGDGHDRMSDDASEHTHHSIQDIATRTRFHVECERPQANMYRLNATVVTSEERYPVDLSMVLLRGMVLRNTPYVVGCVLFTGEDTKIAMNSGGTPSKRSKVERGMEPMVMANLTILAVMAIACGIADSSIEKSLYPQQAPWLYGADRSNDNPSIDGLITAAFALITFQNIVPISLYISIEFVRTCQAAFIYFDADICYERTDEQGNTNWTPTLARSWNLSDDLGQIQYIFSDKTGTLTQNAMVFRRCSIAGKAYRGDDEANSNSELVELSAADEMVKTDRVDSRTASEGSGAQTSSSTAVRPAAPRRVSSKPRFHDAELAKDIVQTVNISAEPSDFTSRARSMNGFFHVLALCHTVLTSEDAETGCIEYKAQSPDEEALVQAAADVGYIFRGRDKEILTLQTPPGEDGHQVLERYELLDVLEFTSARKRMSVVIRKLADDDGEEAEAGGRIFLLTKGADNVIFERLKPGADDALRQTTEEHLDDFASEGLRTLTLAFRVVGESEYAAWSERYHAATVALENRETLIEEVCTELEYDLRLLGATAIEDKLQDGVPETIADLKLAGIRIWVLTGDKLETAVAIGHSTNLIGRDSNIIIVRGGDRDSNKPVRAQILKTFEDFFPEAYEGEHVFEEFGESGVRDVPVDVLPANDQENVIPLHRINTGVTSIVGSGNGERPGGFVLVIDGAALGHAFADASTKKLLLLLAMQCEGVVCCRVSPLQKALVVKLVKEGLRVMTLAIGDGANDVSMIQAADVGVGISGEEGMQAVNSSDYAIAQFRFLKKLVLVHGHWSYARNGNLIVNFFYKNIICIGILWWFQIYCAWSSTYAFDYTYLLWWNAFFTIAPVIAMGIFDRLVDYHVLMALPELYRYGREGKWFGMKIFTIYMLDGLLQSAIVYFLILYAYESVSARHDGYSGFQYEFATTMCVSAVMVANLFNGLNTNAWTGWVFFAVSLGIVLVWAYTGIYPLISPGWFSTTGYGLAYFLFRSPLFWFGIPLTLCLSLLPRYLFKAWQFGYSPNDIDIMRYAVKNGTMQDIERQARSGHLQHLRRPAGDSESGVLRHGPSAVSLPAAAVVASHSRATVDRLGSQTDMATGMRSVHRGFDFVMEEPGPAMQRMQTSLSERRESRRHLPENTPRSSHRFSFKRKGLFKHKHHHDQDS